MARRFIEDEADTQNTQYPGGRNAGCQLSTKSLAPAAPTVASPRRTAASQQGRGRQYSVGGGLQGGILQVESIRTAFSGFRKNYWASAG